MGLYIFKYCINIPLQGMPNQVETGALNQVKTEALNQLGVEDIDQRIADAKNTVDIFGKIGTGKHILDTVFIIRAASYRECFDLIRVQKSLLESDAWQKGTFGSEFTLMPYERYDVMENRIHTVSCINPSGLLDAILCYKINESVACNILFTDAMHYAESCMNSFRRGWDLGEYRKNLVYNSERELLSSVKNKCGETNLFN